MAILKADRIANLLEQGLRFEPEDAAQQDPLVIAPRPNLRELRESGSASVDLRLGTWFVTLRQGQTTHLGLKDGRYYEKYSKTLYVPFNEDYYVHPGHFTLGITLEWLRFPSNLAGYLIGRSSWGRRGLIIATAAGVHPGFKGCLTLEISNVGEVPIAIRPGMPICQLCLHTVESDEPSNIERIDKSRFVGQRKPVVGDIEPDEFTLRLGTSGQRSPLP